MFDFAVIRYPRHPGPISANGPHHSSSPQIASQILTHGLYAVAGQHHLPQVEEDQSMIRHLGPDTGSAVAAQDEALPEAGVRIDPSRSEAP